ncbi:hypothetical protein BJV74DRAFT_797305 [Russula compacta]|nr:hypothetical protein BJV74DRAFT_797305 [Russula compacta]
MASPAILQRLGSDVPETLYYINDLAFDEDCEVFFQLERDPLPGLLGFLAVFIWFMNCKWNWQEIFTMLNSLLAVLCEAVAEAQRTPLGATRRQPHKRYIQQSGANSQSPPVMPSPPPLPSGSPPPSPPPPPLSGNAPGLCGLTRDQWHVVLIILPFILLSLIVPIIVSWLRSEDIGFLWLRVQRRAETTRAGLREKLFGHLLTENDLRDPRIALDSSVNPRRYPNFSFILDPLLSLLLRPESGRP